MSTTGALRGLKVIEIAQGWAGPLAGSVFADFGAEVIKVESIQHPDWWRGAAAGEDDGFTHERSWFYNGINRNKTGITLDLSKDRGRDLLLELIAEADVFIENFTSRVVKQLRLTYEDLSAVNPRIITVSMPAYGTGTDWEDYPALGTTVESMSGVQSLTGYEGGPPRMQNTSWDPVVGTHATFALLAALRRRRETGRGQHIEVSHIEAGTQLVAPALVEYQLTGEAPPRMGNASRTVAPHGCYATKTDEEWVTIAAITDEQWSGLVEVLGGKVNLADERYRTATLRLRNRSKLDEDIEKLTREWDRGELVAQLQKAGVPAAPVSTPADLMADSHLLERGFYVPIDREFVGTHLYPGTWIRLSRTPAAIDRPAPKLGEHNELILKERLGVSDEEMGQLRDQGVIGTRPG